MEIYILYRIRGYERILVVPDKKGQKKPSADKQIKALIRVIRAVGYWMMKLEMLSNLQRSIGIT